MKINWLTKIWATGPHNAFTDICRFNQALYCCFREAINHVSDDGFIRILTLNEHGEIQSSSRIAMQNRDLRDPKLAVTPDGQLILIAYARSNSNHAPSLPSQNYCWISQNGISWSSPRKFADDYWWLWRLRYFKNQAMGFAYNRQHNALNLYQGNPRRTFNMIKPQALSLEKHGKGYPNESDLAFVNDQCFAIVRRDADTYSAQLGMSRSPFKQWRWQDLGFYLGGPVMMALDEQQALVAGRVLHQDTLQTAVFKLKFANGEASDLLLLPSKGDNSYPGITTLNNHIYISYYSSHIDNKSAIYLTQISLD